MKYILILLFCFPAIAGKLNWVTKEGFSTDNKIFMKKSRCEEVTGKSCFSLDDCENRDRRKCKIGLVDNPGDPKFRLVKDSPIKGDCLDFADCAKKAMDPDDDQSTNATVCSVADEGTPKWDDLSNHPDVTTLNGPWFYWCEKANGTFGKMDGVVQMTGQELIDAQAAINDANAAIDAETEMARLEFCGKRTLRKIKLMAKSKGWNKETRRQFRNDWKEVYKDLPEGEIADAITDMQAYTAVGDITQADIDTAINLAQACLAQ